MFGSAILDVAIGLVFVYLLVSLVVTAVNEIIASKLRWRAKDLWLGIKAMLESSAGAEDKKKWTAQLYAHPLIRSLFPFEHQGQEATAGQEGKGPSYIPSRSFALALLDIAGVTGGPLAHLRRVMVQYLSRLSPTGGTLAQLNAAIGGVLGVATQMAEEIADVETELASLEAGAPDFAAKAAAVAGKVRSPELASLARQLGTAAPAGLQRLKDELKWLRELLEELKTDLAGAQAALPKTEAEYAAGLGALLAFAERATARYLHRILERLPAGDLRDTLLTLAEEAQGNLEKLKTGVEVWFNSSMDRVTGWYKKRTQWVHLAIAAGIAIFLNVDTLVVLRGLWSDGPLRQSLVAQAGKFAEKPPIEITAAGSLIRETPTQSPVPAAKTATDPKKPLLVVTPALAQSGDSGVTVKILLAEPAPAEGRKFRLSAGQPNVLTDLPEVVVEKEKKESKEYPIRSAPLTLGTTLSITASEEPGAESEPAIAQLQLTADPQKKYDVLNAQIAELHLPIGWTLIPKEGRGSWTERRKVDPDFRALPDSELWKRSPCIWIGVCLATILFHLIGWALTAVAASLGAPFWFDLLNKIMNIRSSGKAPEEKPKDPKEVPQPREPGNQPAAR